MQHGLTLQDLMSITGCSRQAIAKRRDLDLYTIGTESRGGRPAKLYAPGVLKLWGIEDAVVERPEEEQMRKIRADEGLPRKCSLEQWSAIVERVKALYMNNAQPNLKLACEQARRELGAEGIGVSFNLYAKLWSTRRSRATGEYLSPYRAEKWDIVREKHWKKLDRAKTLPSLNYDYMGLFESMGIAGEGFGALAFWSLDGHSADAWARKDNGKGAMPNALYIRDALTGYPLWIEEIRTETSNAVIRALIKCAIYWGTGPTAGIAVDGGIARAVANMGVIASLLPPSAWELAARFPEVYGRSGSPILHNLPNVPTAPVKAALERSFRQYKDEYDATRHARTYQGGNRLEAVQVRVANKPVINAATPTIPEYFEGFREWVYSDYIQRERPAMFPMMTTRGFPPTIEAVHAYYGGWRAREEHWMPEAERIAYLLYHASESKRVVTCRQPGKVECTIDGTWWPVACAELDYTYVGEKIAIIPLPGDKIHCVVLDAANPKRPKYIGIGYNTLVQDVETLRRVKPRVTAIQSRHRALLQEAAREVAPRQWSTTTPPVEVPALAVDADWLREDHAKSPHTKVTKVQPETDEATIINGDTAELLTDTAELLDDIESLLE